MLFFICENLCHLWINPNGRFGRHGDQYRRGDRAATLLSDAVETRRGTEHPQSSPIRIRRCPETILMANRESAHAEKLPLAPRGERAGRPR